ncbi:MAG: FkbM family methyltransferase [Siculibacillus sp.]|nr:FkbM family methyltransferase [Siculibacillus sp.]
MSALRSFFWTVLHDLVARLGLFGLKRRVIAAKDGLMTATFADGRTLWFVAPRRIRLYSWGWDERLARVARRYGAEARFTVSPGDTVLDIGANVGEFTLYAATRGADVIAVEPDRLNFRAWSNNTAAFPNARGFQFAVSDHDGEATFWAFPEGADSSLIEPEHWSDKYTVPVKRLDDFILSLGVTRVDVIKCDTEGAEPEMLRGSERILPITRKVVIDVSPERNGKSTAAECEPLLRAAGFAVEYFHKGRILVATRP